MQHGIGFPRTGIATTIAIPWNGQQKLEDIFDAIWSNNPVWLGFPLNTRSPFIKWYKGFSLPI